MSERTSHGRTYSPRGDMAGMLIWARGYRAICDIIVLRITLRRILGGSIRDSIELGGRYIDIGEFKEENPQRSARTVFPREPIPQLITVRAPTLEGPSS